MAITKKETTLKNKNLISEKEYLEREFLAETKSEYHAGKLIAMAGVTLVHNLITSNLIRLLGNCLEDSKCKVLNSDMLIHLPKCKKYYYPDMTVVCENPEFAEKKNGRSEALTNPQIIIEVLSKGTAEYDMGEKMKCYLTLKSLQQYVIVSSERKLIITYTKDKEGDFKVKTYSENDTVLIGECQMLIEKVYNKVGFETTNKEDQNVKEE
jgi:Uma2 family endonuclease